MPRPGQHPIRVLHVVSGLSPRMGGPSKATLQMCQALAGAGLMVSVYSPNLARDDRWFSFSNQEVLDVPIDRPVDAGGVSIHYFPTHWPHRFAFSPRMGTRLRETIRDFDLVHIHSLYLYPTLVAAHYARKFSVPYLIRPHGTLHPYVRRRHRLRKSVYERLFERRNLDNAAAIHYTSQSEMETAMSLRFKAPWLVSPLGIDPADFSSLPPRGSFRARNCQLQQKRLVLFLGRLTRKKGLDLLIPAMTTVMKQIDGVHLVIAGPDDEGYGSEVRGLLDKCGIAKQTSVLGMVDGREKLELLVDADVWVLPSRTENFGLAAVEAMACGLPIVISDQVDIHDEVTRAGAGYVIPCRTDMIAESVTRLLSQASLRESLGRAARHLATTQFDWETVAGQLITVYRGIICNRAKGERNLLIKTGEEAISNARTS